MLLSLVKPLAAGDSFDLTLNFDSHDPIAVAVPVVDIMQTMPGMSEDMQGMDHGTTQGMDQAQAS